MDVSHLIDRLNPPQREAVSAPLQSRLVLAGAGSGKTRVLVHRIAWLIQVEQISPYAIMAVTFTNKAAKEMRSRIEALLGLTPRGMWVGTFHGLAHRLLRAHHREANLPENFQILDSDDQLRLVKRICRELNLDEKRWDPKELTWFINAQKDEGLRPQHLDSYGDSSWQTRIDVYKAYEEACQRGGMVDFGELLLRSHELWLNQPVLLRHYQQRFQALLVDEFQDTNKIQYAWLRMLAGERMPVMAVGDDDQSIYGWRGARIENIQNFTSDFPGTEIIRLEQNYRSTDTILQAANALIANNQGRMGKQLWTDSGEGEKIAVYSAFNEQEEARFIVEQAEKWADQGGMRQEVAILYRSNAQSRVLEEALVRAGVPYRIYGGQRFYDRLEIRNALAYLRLMQNRHDDAAMERVINVPTRGIGSKTLETVRDYARQQQVSLWQASVEAIERRLLSGRAAGALLPFIELINQLQRDSESLAMADTIALMLQHSGLVEHHEKDKDKGEARAENLQELVNAARQFEQSWSPDEEDEQAGLTDVLAAFIDQAALDAGDAQAAEFSDCVQLMTLHSAKGLEFPLVFMAGLEESLFPHSMSMEDPQGLEEERRLCYVGITRARQKLFMTWAESRRFYGQEERRTHSRFLREIPEQLLEEVRLGASIRRPLSFQRPTSPSFAEAEVPATEFYLGQRVIHGTFGEGILTNFEGQGPKARVEVNFDDVGSKWLILSMAKLQAL
ncbi:DNA-dependent helicase II [Pokkaliibacter plantistimulans]|uniref:DNA 3'-5' helicase n=2 Tax=Pseudomonadota TaxID=1224 RepID=A0ABX5M0Z0_9GAMM|nr:DNA helicase II [Pokkaliibacter plantistimulans]PPC76245.1 DNA helicase II [Pokkaliibacter plantistimulans]PXF32206.1 DNA-dependent helicase II [Pokkaliibacter plantistimulans]